MNLQELQHYFTIHPSALTMGAGKIGKRTHSHPEIVREAKRLYRLGYKVKQSDRIKPNFPKILIFDIETAPIKAWVWNTWKENISLDKTISDYFILCWSAKWLYSDDIFGARLTPEEVFNEDDSRIVKELWKAFDDADIIIAHNGCVEKNTPILMKDFTWKSAGELKVGDEILAFEEGLPPHVPMRNKKGKWQNPLKGKERNLIPAIITHNDVVKEYCVKVTFTNGYSLITTLDHPWLMKTQKDNFFKWRESIKLKPGDRVVRVCKPWEKDTSYEGAWMSGYISGEGSLLKNSGSGVSGIQWCQRPTVVKETADKYADKLGINRFDYLPKTNWGLGKGDCIYTNTTGGKWKTFQWLGSLDLKRLITHVDYTKLGTLYGVNTETNDQEEYYVKSVELCGEHEIARLSTSTGTYIADGFAMHNCSFDIPRMNTRFILNGLNPPTPYQVVDTLKVAKKQFGFTSNKLQALATYFGFDGKLDTDFNLWKRCMNGDEEALQYMFDYNKQDVNVLEEVYLKLLPFITNHPNMGNLMNNTVCSNCGSDELELIPNKYYYTSVGKYALYRCKDCGAITRGRKNLNSTPIKLAPRLR